MLFLPVYFNTNIIFLVCPIWRAIVNIAGLSKLMEVNQCSIGNLRIRKDLRHKKWSHQEDGLLSKVVFNQGSTACEYHLCRKESLGTECSFQLRPTCSCTSLKMITDVDQRYQCYNYKKNPYYKVVFVKNMTKEQTSLKNRAR